MGPELAVARWGRWRWHARPGFPVWRPAHPSPQCRLGQPQPTADEVQGYRALPAIDRWAPGPCKPALPVLSVTSLARLTSARMSLITMAALLELERWAEGCRHWDLLSAPTPSVGECGPPPGWEHKHDNVLSTSHLDEGRLVALFPFYVPSFF